MTIDTTKAPIDGSGAMCKNFASDLDSDSTMGKDDEVMWWCVTYGRSFCPLVL